MSPPRGKGGRSALEEEREVMKRLGVEVTAEAVIAAGAFILSLTTAGAQLYLAMRGPVIDALPIERALLYRDGNQNGARLVLAARTTLINTASSDYGDIVEQAVIRLTPPGGKPVTFPFDTIIKTHIVDNPEAAAAKCDVDARCIALKDLVIDDRNERLIDLPGGKARQDYLTFVVQSHHCQGAAADCARFADFDAAADTLSGQPLAFSLTLKFHTAKPRTLGCKSKVVDAANLRGTGWLSFTCA